MGQAPRDEAAEPVLVWGAGAIGGSIAAYWARAGVPVLLVDVVGEHVQACRSTGLRIEGPLDEFTQVIPAVTPQELDGRHSRIVLAVKAQNTAAAMRDLLPHLADDGFVLSAQNGLNEITIAEMAGAHRTMGCYLGFASDWLGPGQVLYGGRGEVVVGEIDGVTRPRTVQMHELLRRFEPDAFMPERPESDSREALATLATRWRHSAKKHSGMWRDMAVRKRRTEVDALMGPVVAFGRQAGIPTPAVAALIELIHEIEDGRRMQSRETFDALAARVSGAG